MARRKFMGILFLVVLTVGNIFFSRLLTKKDQRQAHKHYISKQNSHAPKSQPTTSMTIIKVPFIHPMEHLMEAGALDYLLPDGNNGKYNDDENNNVNVPDNNDNNIHVSNNNNNEDNIGNYNLQIPSNFNRDPILQQMDSLNNNNNNNNNNENMAPLQNNRPPYQQNFNSYNQSPNNHMTNHLSSFNSISSQSGNRLQFNPQKPMNDQRIVNRNNLINRFDFNQGNTNNPRMQLTSHNNGDNVIFSNRNTNSNAYNVVNNAPIENHDYKAANNIIMTSNVVGNSQNTDYLFQPNNNSDIPGKVIDENVVGLSGIGDGEYQPFVGLDNPGLPDGVASILDTLKKLVAPKEAANHQDNKMLSVDNFGIINNIMKNKSSLKSQGINFVPHKNHDVKVFGGGSMFTNSEKSNNNHNMNMKNNNNDNTNNKNNNSEVQNVNNNTAGSLKNLEKQLEVYKKMMGNIVNSNGIDIKSDEGDMLSAVFNKVENLIKAGKELKAT